MNCAHAVGAAMVADMVADMEAGVVCAPDTAPEALWARLAEEGERATSAGEAAAIHAEEERRGKVADKPREKIVRVEEMMRVVMDAPGKE